MRVRKIFRTLFCADICLTHWMLIVRVVKGVSTMKNGRKEIKHAISYPQYMMMKSKLAHVMQLDAHANANGKYLIRSTYFDNFSNKALNEKKEGYLHRDKYRVRIYDKAATTVYLERKSKRHNMTFKTKCLMTKAEYEKMRRSELEWMEKDERALIRDLYEQMMYQQLKPVTVVDYEREAYVYPFGNVRVTFDSKIQTSVRNNDMFQPYLPMVDVLEPNMLVLEVKYDEYLPDIIKYLLQSVDTHAEAYSKYQLSRMFG